MLQANDKMRKILERQVIRMKMQPQTLQLILTGAKTHKETPNPTVRKCGRTNCGTCLSLPN